MQGVNNTLTDVSQHSQWQGAINHRRVERLIKNQDNEIQIGTRILVKPYGQIVPLWMMINEVLSLDPFEALASDAVPGSEHFTVYRVKQCHLLDTMHRIGDSTRSKV